MSEIRQSKNVDKLLRRVIGDEPPLRLSARPLRSGLGRRRMSADSARGDLEIGLARRTVLSLRGGTRLVPPRPELDGASTHCPPCEMIHYQGKSSAQMSDFSLAHLVETRLRYYRKNHGRRWRP